ncbi:TRBM protein, partial [Upupa epops]|nr:TRBM protein [Upupa epops]
PSGAQCLEHDCFGIFWATRDFTEASEACERSGGHLMTVRSTVAEDAIALLLQNRSGRLWLGLHLPFRCTEPTQRLRGFQWVTGDRRTDYSNWAPSGQRCGQRCVTVSQQLRWEERRCEEPADGFLCEYNYGGSCPRLPPTEGLTVTYITPFGARGGDFMALPPRSTAVIPAMQLELRCNEDTESGGLSWGLDGPGAWPCHLANGGCEEICGEELGQPRCSCLDGKVLGPDKRSCSSPCAGAPCEHHCVVSGTTFLCMCEPGYQLAANGYSCEDVDDCAVLPNVCDQVCRNTKGGFECLCHNGYEMVDGRCRRVSHCHQAPCKQKCEDVPTGYLCSCYLGYAVHPKEPWRCVLHCNQSQCPAMCDSNTNSCECPDGFVLDDDDPREKVCVDIDECAMNYCQQYCNNYPGSYKCHCSAGFQLIDQTECIKVAEEDGEGMQSGDSEPTPQLPVPSRIPPKTERLHPGALVGITVGAVSAALALLALGYHLMKKHSRPPATMDYKCSGPHEKEMGLQPVAST